MPVILKPKLIKSIKHTRNNKKTISLLRHKKNTTSNNLIYSNYNNILTNTNIENKLSPVKHKYCIIFRGHVRDAFKSDRLYIFLSYLINDMGLDIDIYIYVWLNIEAKIGHSWRNLSDSSDIITNTDINNYFRGIPIKELYITDENTNILIGDCSGKISGTSKKGWKNMWCGIDEINNIVKKTGINYYGVINTRLDFFGNYIFNTYYKNYGLSYFYNLISEYDNNKSITFWENKELMGIDNFYIGNINDICKLSNDFHNNLDKIIKNFPKTIHQEFYVFRYVNRHINIE